MKNYLVPFTFAFLFFLHASTVKAQQFTFNRVELFEENVRGFITAIVQDSKGYMWFTGVNLYRYDGYKMVTYKNDPLDSNSLAPSRLESIYIDRKGIIWIGTFGSGLDRFDPETGIFTHFPNKPDDPASLSHNIVTSIIEDNEGILWVGTHGGLNRMDQKTGKFIRYQNNPSDTASLSNDQVRTLYLDKQGTIWVGCGSPFGNESPGGAGGLNRLDKKTGKFIRYMHDPKKPNSLFDNKIRALCEDSQGNFWVGTAGGGLHIMNRQNGTFKRYMYDPLHPEKLSAPPKKGDFYHVTFIHEDITGGIWIGAFPGGLNHFDPKTSKLTRYEANKDDPESLKENSVWYAYSSSEGVLWISTQFFVYRVDPLRKHIPHVNTGSRVNAFNEEVSGVLWMGTDSGLIRSGLNKAGMEKFVHDSLNPRSLSSNRVLSLYRDKEDRLWVGTANGLNLLNSKTKTFTRYQHTVKNNSSISEGSVLSIIEDRHGMFWIGTEGGLDMMNRQTGLFTRYTHNSKDSNSLSNNTVKCMYG
ncbi:MAG: two-component regulator propeller domain-containing protein [Segetibacter sp.]